ncbi:MAG: hypothetical protein RL754_1160 [Bacteroidota bacterium]|jgi:hypothetical protein
MGSQSHKAIYRGIFIATHLLMQLAFWVDEGYYDFRWMREPGNWIVYTLYSTVVFTVQAGFYALFYGKGQPMWWKGALAFTAGYFIVIMGLYLSYLWIY